MPPPFAGSPNRSCARKSRRWRRLARSASSNPTSASRRGSADHWRAGGGEAMLFRRFLPGLPPILAGDRLYLRAPEISDFEAWAPLRAISRDHLQPWEPAWAAVSLTREGYRRPLAWFALGRASCRERVGKYV